MSESRKLTPGAVARIYRDAGVLSGVVNVPVAGPLELRHLPPGAYVARDELGGEASFVVGPRDESVVVATGAGGELVGGSGEPGSSHTSPGSPGLVGRVQGEPGEPIRPKLAKAAVGADVARDDVRAEGAPGSSTVDVVPDVPMPVMPGNEQSAEDRAATERAGGKPRARRAPAKAASGKGSKVSGRSKKAPARRSGKK